MTLRQIEYPKEFWYHKADLTLGVNLFDTHAIRARYYLRQIPILTDPCYQPAPLLVKLIALKKEVFPLWEPNPYQEKVLADNPTSYQSISCCDICVLPRGNYCNIKITEEKKTKCHNQDPVVLSGKENRKAKH